MKRALHVGILRPETLPAVLRFIVFGQYQFTVTKEVVTKFLDSSASTTINLFPDNYSSTVILDDVYSTKIIGRLTRREVSNRRVSRRLGEIKRATPIQVERGAPNGTRSEGIEGTKFSGEKIHSYHDSSPIVVPYAEEVADQEKTFGIDVSSLMWCF